jgi:hypothetical protein
MAITAALPDRLFRFLRDGAPAVLMTVGADGWGHGVMTWAAAIAREHVRFVVDHGSTTLTNLERDGKATLQVIGPERLLALLKGPARLLRERVSAAPFGMALWEMTLIQVKDQAWGDVAVSPLAFQWTGPRAEEFRRIEQAVLAEMRA